MGRESDRHVRSLRRSAALFLAAVHLLACGGGGDATSGPGPGAGDPADGAPSTGDVGGDADEGPSDTDPRTVTIEMYRISYVAPTASDIVTIKLGESVRWVNRDGTRHTATSDSVPPGGKGFSTGWLEPGGEYVFRPNVTGTWVYSCLQYPDRMSGARLRVVP